MKTLPCCRWIALLATAALLAACYPVRDTSRPPATKTLPGDRHATTLVIALPGIADNLASLEAGGIGNAVHGAWPDADVELVELTIGYYKDGRALPALHDLVATARREGYRHVWLAGASLGGMGALLYDTAWPDDVDGLVLLAPYLGDEAILKDIRAAGGVVRWQAPPAAMPGPENWQAQLWRRVKAWSARPGGDSRVWLAYGDKDKFAPNMPLLAPAVPASHIVTGPGVHEWTTWTPLAARVFARAPHGAATP
ncbi:alpha/beta hydrolase-fold protein [Luteibacter sp. PPL201]|uniref:Alpha/beta hydrolase-fold protein n=1 Tax=Luteibacter sahnii TaxID=3021977 RepID=A0ABT6BCR6_9GAMM|nr:alpha/beta hydrolase-fold protein [Luteibacter sp. PPL193]MDY1549343.1 alpha/beta hydrolase-fold protein [Luteibacter sp. PPL193]